MATISTCWGGSLGTSGNCFDPPTYNQDPCLSPKGWTPEIISIFIWNIMKAASYNDQKVMMDDPSKLSKKADNEPVAEPEPESSLVEKLKMKKMVAKKTPTVQYYYPEVWFLNLKNNLLSHMLSSFLKVYLPMVQYPNLHPPMVLYG